MNKPLETVSTRSNTTRWQQVITLLSRFVAVADQNPHEITNMNIRRLLEKVAALEDRINKLEGVGGRRS